MPRILTLKVSGRRRVDKKGIRERTDCGGRLIEPVPNSTGGGKKEGKKERSVRDLSWVPFRSSAMSCLEGKLAPPL